MPFIALPLFCQNVMPIPLEIRLWSPEFKHLFSPGGAVWVHSAKRWQWGLQSPCSLWILLVFNRLQETWLSSPIPTAEMMLSKVAVSPLALLGGRIFLEREGPVAGMTIGDWWKPMEMGMNLGLTVTTTHCKSTFEQKLVAIMKFNNGNVELHG